MPEPVGPRKEPKVIHFRMERKKLEEEVNPSFADVVINGIETQARILYDENYLAVEANASCPDCGHLVTFLKPNVKEKTFTSCQNCNPTKNIVPFKTFHVQAKTRLNTFQIDKENAAENTTTTTTLPPEPKQTPETGQGPTPLQLTTTPAPKIKQTTTPKPTTTTTTTTTPKPKPIPTTTTPPPPIKPLNIHKEEISANDELVELLKDLDVDLNS